MAAKRWSPLAGIFCMGMLCGVSFSEDNDPCTEPVDLSDPKRSEDYTESSGNYICDHGRIVEGTWYTLDSYRGGKMPESCPDSYSCGTQGPIWFNGSHPTDDSIHNATACARLSGCCDQSYDIKVKKCADETFVYQLANPSGCDLAYCAGSGVPCEDGKVWVDGQCTDGYPVMSDPPILTGPIPPADHFFGTFNFSCDIQTEENSNSAHFEVRWYFDGVEDTNIGVTDTTKHSVILNELKLNGHMGKTMSCSAKSYWEGNIDLASEEVASDNSYWVGIQGPDLTIISEDSEDDTEIVFTTTVPITCGCCLGEDVGLPFKTKNDCKFVFRINSYGTEHDQAQSCDVTFYPGNQSSSLYARAERIGNIRSQLSQISFNKYVNLFQNPIWNDYMVQPTLVQLKNPIRTGHCKSVTDPHITTFDGKYYHLYQPGNFLLVNSSSTRLFEIHSHLRTCLRNPSVSCNCGVAVREGNIIIGVDNCEGHFRSFKKRLLGTSQNHGTLTTNAAGTDFTIVMPSGARVVARNDKSWHLNVDVYLPSEDHNKTEGLCGNWDGNPNNDFQKRFNGGEVSSSISVPREFTDSYKLAAGKSFFDGIPECEKLLNVDKPNHCKCESGSDVTCTPFDDDDEIIDHKFDDVCNSKKKKRQVDEFAAIFGDLAEEEDYTELGDITWPTPSGITKDEAKDKCRQVFGRSHVNDVCQSVVTVNITELEESCVFDIQIGNNLTYGDSMGNVFESQCKEESRLNVIIGNDTDESAQELAEAIDSIVCINQCSGHGTCVNSVCQCEADYLGADCSVDIGTPPVISALLNDGLCDTYLGTCRGIKVTANVVINGTVCRYREVEVTTNNVNDLNVEIQTTSQIFSSTKAFCQLPNDIGKVYATYQLAISLDGETFSEETMVYIYNSECAECSVGDPCYIKADSCDIAGQCYSGMTCTACEDAIDIGDPKRSSVYELQAHDIYLCDAYRIVEGSWYKFDQYTGNQIPEHCVDTWHCGTQATIWLNGTHPTVDIPVTSGLACANYHDMTCCDWSAPVSIKYCTDSEDEVFYAYQLTPPPGCEMAYCSGDVMPCLEGEEWDDDNDICVDIDECASDPCVHGDCLNNANHFVCDCEEGYTGVTCNEEINKCDVEPCVHGSCEASFNSYTCLCDAGFTGTDCELDIDECESSPCENNGECTNGENQYMCNCSTGYSGERCTTGVWAGWEEWGSCSTTCGSGYTQRERSCMVEEELCEGDNVDFDICNLVECDTSVLDSEETGTEVEVSPESIDEVIVNEGDFKEAIADSINNYCRDHEEECCTAMGLTFSLSATQNLVIPSSVTVTLQGENEETGNIRLVIVIDIDVARANAFCGSENVEDSVSINEETVADAITANSDTIESDTGIVITEVGRQTDDRQKEAATDSTGQSTNLALIIALAVVGAIALAACIALIWFCAKKKSKKQKTQRTPSSVTVHSSRNVQGVGEISTQPADPDMFLANQYTSAPPQYFNYDKMRPKTGVKRNTALPPLQNF